MKGVQPDHGFNDLSPATRSGVYYFSQGWKLVSAAGHPTLRYFAVVGQHYSDGRRLLVAHSQAGKLDPFPNEPCPRLVAVARATCYGRLRLSPLLLVFGYFFSTIANWIAAPFNGLLAEQLEARPYQVRRHLTRAYWGIVKDRPPHHGA